MNPQDVSIRELERQKNAFLNKLTEVVRKQTAPKTPSSSQESRQKGDAESD